MRSATQQFDFRVSEIVVSIEQRLKAYENALQGGAGLFAATESVRPEDWQKYTQSLDLHQNFPGIQGLGWAQAVRPEEKEALVEEARTWGYPEFFIWPEGNRQFYAPITYLEPANWRNRRAMGYDMFSEPARREAMIRARDTGQVSATRAVSLVQETNRDVQPGFLMYLSVYQGGALPPTVEERRQQLLGFVYSPFRMRDLMQGILGPNAMNDVHMEVFDGAGTDPEVKIYGSIAEPERLLTEELFQTVVPFEFNGHRWTLRFASMAPLEALARASNSNLVLIGGCLLSFLLAGFIWALWLNQIRRRALDQAHMTLAEEATQREHLELRLDRFFSLSTDMLCTLSLDGTLQAVNPAWNDILGFHSREIIGQRLVATVHEDDRERVSAGLSALACNRVHRATMEVRNLTADGGVRWVEWHLVAAEEERALYANGRDVNERREMEQQLHRSAFYDALTGMANRALFLDRLQHVIERAHRYGERFAVMILDLDNFKNVNDSFGHLVGDRLLAGFAERVQQQLRPVDTCARFGGDEFILLMEEAANVRDVRYVAERIQHALGVPFVIDGHEVFASSSMGIAMGDRRCSSIQQVLRDADTALYEAKRQGKNLSLVFDAQMREEQLTRKVVEDELNQALERQELDVVYQPIVDLQTDLPVGCEALVRWNHPQLGKMQPEEFVSVAENTGFINAIGRFVTDKACRDLAGWLADPAVPDTFYVGVNLSPKEFFVGNLVENIQQALERAGLEGRNLRLEVTEGVLIDRYQDAASIFSGLREMGVKICIDDFGTGYSSLSYLQSLPIDVLKLDRSLIEQIQVSDKSREIARTVLGLARALNVQSVAEGVETDLQLRAIKDLGFNLAQGFRLHRPMSGSAIRDLLHRSTAEQNT